MPTDSSAIIINEKAITALGLQDPIGKTINQVSGAGGSIPFTVIGVIKDFHVESLQNPIRPTVLTMVRPDNMELASVKVKTAQIKESMEFIEAQWKKIVPEVPFEYNFFDDRYQLAYEQEIKSGILISAFTLLTVFIAALGLFGLSAFSAEQRTKEIGIRKVMGASLGQTTILLVRDYMKWILLASALAFPVGWYSMNHWLQTYTYRIDPSIFSFVGVTLIAMAIALLTVSIQTIKTALTNPVKALRYE
jgi:putative ABC transport system permease protein